MAIKLSNTKKSAPKIEIEIDMTTGAVTAEAAGYAGQACSLDMNAIMDAVGEKTKHIPQAPERDQNVVRTQRT